MRGSAGTWVLVLALAGAGAVGWLLVDGPAATTDEFLETSERADTATSTGPLLSGQGRARAPSAPVEEGRFAIVGRVVDAQGRPLAGIPVAARRTGDAPAGNDRRRVWDPVAALARLFEAEGAGVALAAAAHATSAQDGTFRLEVTRRGIYAVRAEPAEPLVGTEATWTQGATPPTEPLELRVLAGSTLRGRVVDGQDRGLEVALSAAWSNAQEHWSSLPTRSAPGTGAFRFGGVPAGKVRLTVTLPGRLTFTTAAIVAPTDEEIVIRLPESAPLLVGSVKALDGSPIAGARIAASIQRAYEAGAAPRGEGVYARYLATSDAEGAYALGGPFAGALTQLEVAASGYVLHTGQPPVAPWSGMELGAGRQERIDVVLYQGGTLEGRVTEVGSGAPLAGAQIDVLAMAVDARMTRPPVARAESDAQGRYSVVGVAVGRSLLLVRHPTHHVPAQEALARQDLREVMVFPEDDMQGPGAPPELTVFVEREGQRVTRDLALAPGRRVSGRVLDAQGRPVEGAQVRAKGLGLGQAAWRWGVQPDGQAASLATSGPDGRFEIPGLAPRPDWVLYAHKPPLIGEPCAAFALGEGAAPKDLVLKLVGGCSVTGRAVDARGVPVAGATLWFHSQNPDGIQFEAPQVRTREDGSFRAQGLPAGTLGVSAQSREHGNVYQQIEGLGANEVREGVEIKFTSEPGGLLAGVLVDERGQPVVRKPLLAWNQGTGSTSQTWTDEGGAFQFEGLSKGQVQVATGDWQARTELAVVACPAQDLRIVWKEPPSAVLEGLVVDPQGRPVPLCQVSIKAAGKGPRDMMMAWNGGTGDLVVNGWFRRHVQGAAPYTIKVSRPQDGEGRALNLMGKTVPVPDPKAGPITIALEPGAEIAGRVLDPAGQGVSGVSVSGGGISTTTDAQGGFALGGLAEGQVSLQVAPRAPFSRPAPLKVATGTRDVVIRLSSGLAIAGEVRRADGSHAQGGWVNATWQVPGAPAGNANASFSQDGRFRIEGVPPEAQVTLTVQVWDGEGEQGAPKTVPNVRPGTEDLVIEIGAGATLAGSVTEPDGKPFSQGWVQVARAKEGQQEVLHHAEIKEDGRFAIRGLEPGTAVLLSVVGKEGGQVSTPVSVTPPATNVRLSVPARTPIKGRLTGSLGSGRWRVWAWEQTNVSRTVRGRVEPDGRFALDGIVGAGPWMLAARSADDDRYALLGPVESGATNVSLELRQGRSIEGRVVLVDGSSPAPDVTVNLAGSGWTTAARTDAQGVFRLRGLPPGRYQLQAWSEDGEMASQSDVEDGATGVRLTLQPGR